MSKKKPRKRDTLDADALQDILSTDRLEPRDAAEQWSLFRAQILGPVTARALRRGDLTAELRDLSTQHFRRPEKAPRKYSVTTLQRWLSRYRQDGLSGLQRQPRSDQGYAQGLTEAQRNLLLNIGRERPEAPVSVILRTLVALGRIKQDRVTASTIRRLFAAHGLDAKSRTKNAKEQRRRRRWAAAAVEDLLHADVCHGPTLVNAQGKKIPLRIHAFLDDHSRYVPVIKAASTEREVEMLALLVSMLRQGVRPGALYLDNGATYRGELLKTVCTRLGIRLIHAKPYDPQARGKMERFWRTLRDGGLLFLDGCTSLHDVQVRLIAFLAQHYHPHPHAGLMGRAPGRVWAEGRTAKPPFSEQELREALTVRGNRKVRADGTVSIGGVDWEVCDGFLAHRKITIARTLLEPETAPWIEHEDQILRVRRVDPVVNGRRRSPKSVSRSALDLIPFDPAGALLDQALGRRRPDKKESP